MTLVLTVVRPDYVVQVGDRLVTRGDVEFDTLANKQVVVEAVDGTALVCYSGSAYTGDRTTDHWLAGVILGHPYEPVGGHLAIRSAGLGESSILDVCDRVRRAVDEYEEGLGITVGISGFRDLPDGPVPFLAQSQRHRDVVEHQPQSGQGIGVGLLIVPDSRVAENKIERAQRRLVNPRSNVDRTERVLVDLVRSEAGRRPGVGELCLALQLLPSHHVTVRYLVPGDEAPEVEVVTGYNQVSVVAGAYTPWFVTPGWTVPAGKHAGAGSEMSIGSLGVLVDGPPVDRPGLGFAFGCQPRPSRP